MTKDIEREAFEKISEIAEILDEEKSHFNGDFYNLPFNSCAESFINGAWHGWQAAKAQEAEKLKGCVVVPIKCPDPDFADLLFDELGKKAIGTFGEDMLIHFSDINEEKIWDLMLEAARAEMSNQLKPCEVVRNRFGCWVHPVYLKYLNDHFADTEYLSREDWNELKRHFNIVTTTMHLESCVSADEYDEIMDGCDLSRWTPPIPHGFFLIDIGFTEDGAEAIFAKELKADAEG